MQTNYLEFIARFLRFCATNNDPIVVLELQMANNEPFKEKALKGVPASAFSEVNPPLVKGELITFFGIPEEDNGRLAIREPKDVSRVSEC